jgi:hypothetical protein
MEERIKKEYMKILKETVRMREWISVRMMGYSYLLFHYILYVFSDESDHLRYELKL